jgi:hypothetical protein
MCDQPIGASYLREVGTHLTYCDHDCYADHCESAFLLLENRGTSIMNLDGKPSRTFGQSKERTLR